MTSRKQQRIPTTLKAEVAATIRKSNKTKQQQQWKIVERKKTGKTTVVQSQNTNETLGEFRRFP